MNSVKLSDKKFIQNSVVFLYTNHEQEREFRKNIIHNCIKNNKVSRFKFKEIRDLNFEKCKTLMEKLKITQTERYTILMYWKN